MNFSALAAILRILLLGLGFSIDSIPTAAGMAEHVPVMYVAVLVLLLALGLLLMTGVVLIGEEFGAYPQGLY